MPGEAIGVPQITTIGRFEVDGTTARRGPSSTIYSARIAVPAKGENPGDECFVEVLSQEAQKLGPDALEQWEVWCDENIVPTEEHKGIRFAIHQEDPGSDGLMPRMITSGVRKTVEGGDGETLQVWRGIKKVMRGAGCEDDFGGRFVMEEGDKLAVSLREGTKPAIVENALDPDTGMPTGERFAVTDEKYESGAEIDATEISGEKWGLRVHQRYPDEVNPDRTYWIPYASIESIEVHKGNGDVVGGYEPQARQELPKWSQYYEEPS